MVMGTGIYLLIGKKVRVHDRVGTLEKVRLPIFADGCGYLVTLMTSDGVLNLRAQANELQPA